MLRAALQSSALRDAVQALMFAGAEAGLSDENAALLMAAPQMLHISRAGSRAPGCRPHGRLLATASWIFLTCFAPVQAAMFGDGEGEPSKDHAVLLCWEACKVGLPLVLAHKLTLLDFETRKDAAQVRLALLL